jgi:N-acyl-D-aspartate/D-glutamate deacylase
MSQSRLRLAALSACFLCASALGEEGVGAEGPFDLIIANGHIIDGTGSPWYSGDVGIRGGRIAAIGNLAHAAAQRRIDAAGDVVAPGFIDILGQSEFTILVDPRLPSKIYQGITTEITGEGNSAAPMTGQARIEAAQTLEHYGLKADWQSLGEYFARLERQGMGINLASYVGATTVREIVIGDENRPPLVEDNGFTQCAVFGMQEDDVALALVQPWVSIDNDSSGASPQGRLGEEHPHPRAYGTFPRILRKYVREEHRLRLEDAIRKFSALPAQRMRLADRGVLKRGLWADVVVFDPATIADRSTFSSPNELAVGMRWVLVNGVPVIADGQMTGAKPGHVLRGPGYRAPGV